MALSPIPVWPGGGGSSCHRSFPAAGCRYRVRDPGSAGFGNLLRLEERAVSSWNLSSVDLLFVITSGSATATEEEGKKAPPPGP